VNKTSTQTVRSLFPKDIEDQLTFEESDKYIIIKPRQYLGSENFAKIASIVRSGGGEYISAGKESHFRVPKAQTQTQIDQQKPPEEPKVYRKGDTIVCKLSKGLMITDTYWNDKNVILHTVGRMSRDASGKVLVGADQKPIWEKNTVRLSMNLTAQYISLLNQLVTEKTTKSTIPERA